MSDKYAVKNKLPAKQVSILAHRKKRLIELKSHDRVKQINRAFKLRKKLRNHIKAEVFISNFIKTERDKKRMIRCVKQKQLFKPVANEKCKLLFVMRHRAHKVSSPIINEMLSRLRLGVLFNGVFLRNNIETLALLRLIEPYVIWGFPNINNVREIIFKHGFLNINSKKTAINSNKVIEEQLGTHGIICIEDIVHEIFTVSENFDKIVKMLLPFKLKAPLDGWKNKTGVSFGKGGEYGDRNTEINALMTRCM